MLVSIATLSVTCTILHTMQAVYINSCVDVFPITLCHDCIDPPTDLAFEIAPAYKSHESRYIIIAMIIDHMQIMVESLILLCNSLLVLVQQ